MKGERERQREGDRANKTMHTIAHYSTLHTTSYECHGLRVIHPHSTEGVTYISSRGHRVRDAFWSSGIDIDQSDSGGS